MKKKTIGRIAALSLAALTSVSAMSIVSSAVIDIDGTYASGTVYEAKIDSGNGTRTTKYYTSEDAAKGAVSAAGGTSEYVGTTPITTVGTTIYINGTEVSASNIGGTSYTTRTSSLEPANNFSSSYLYATNYAYKGKDGYWYPNEEALRSAGTTLDYSKPLESYEQWSSDRRYFDPVMGQYYPTGDANGSYLVSRSGSSTTISSSSTASSTYPWYSSYTGRYYKTQDDALAVSQNSSQVSYVGSYYGYWYSSYTNQYYTTRSAALADSLNNPAYVTYVGDYYNGYYGYYYGYGYYNPNYWYYYLTNNTTSTSSSSSSAVSITGSSSWTSLANKIKTTAAGKTISVEMNDETIVPTAVFSALKGKDVTLSLKLGNGVVYRINGKSVTSTKDVNLITTYNTDRVPSTLVKKAYKKYNAVSSAQVSINSNSFGAKVGVTFKFNTKRAGCTARLYRYNSANRTLSLVDTSKVESTGSCTFEGVAKGGDFVVILS